MAQLKGPLHSDSASGTVAKSVIFSKWKGRPYSKRRVTPTNPQSQSQTGIRALIKWCGHWWRFGPYTHEDEWAALAEPKNITPFNAYMAENIKRWLIDKSPTATYPATENLTNLDPDSEGDDGEKLSASGHEGYATLTAIPDSTDCSDANIGIIFRDPTSAPSRSHLQAINLDYRPAGSRWNLTDRKLAPGTYHYKICYCSWDGAIGQLSAADVTATVT
jgi:hypothetical protein